jgi:hypothetical protein
MTILDFLYYYLTNWFNKNQSQLKWSSPMERASYALGLASLGFLYGIGELLEFTLLKFNLPKYLFIFIGLGLMQLYDFIYIKRKRYDSIDPLNSFKLVKNIDDKYRVAIAIIVIFISILSPFIILVLFVPFGGHTLSH